MPSPVAVITATYDGVDIQEAGFFDPATGGLFLEVYRGLAEPPSVRGTDTVVAGSPYRIRRNRVADQLVVGLRGYLAGGGGTPRSDFRTRQDAFEDLFDPRRDVADLVLTCEDGSTRTLSCAPAEDPPLWEVIVPELSRVDLQLIGYTDWAVVLVS